MVLIGGHTHRATSVARHMRHVDFHLMQLLLVGCSHFHHGSPEAADIVTVALCLSVECHGVGGKAVSDGVEAIVVSGYSWHGKVGCNHVACVSMLGQ